MLQSERPENKPRVIRRESEFIEEVAAKNFLEAQEDPIEKIRRGKFAILRRLHQPKNFDAFIKHGNLSSMVLRAPFFNKGTAFTHEERDLLNIRGLLPPRVETLDEQYQRAIQFLNTLKNNLQKYLFLIALSELNETLFYKILSDNLQIYLPIIYSSSLDEVSQQYSNFLMMFQKGMFLSLNEKDKLRETLDNWIFPKVDMIIVTDGSRSLQQKDLGSNAMALCVGKLMLYVAAGGFHPTRILPISLDVGTSNIELRESDKYYLGMRIPRVEDQVYYQFMDEFMEAIQYKWPHAVVQFEDFSVQYARELLERYRNKFPCFNDDIQGTSVVVLAGLLNACKLIGSKLPEQRILCVGAGNSALAISDFIILNSTDQNLDGSAQYDDVRKTIWMMDQEGIVTSSKEGGSLADNSKYAREDWNHETNISLVDAIELIKPTILIGTSGHKGLFEQQVLSKMAEICHRPIIFTLSDPVDHCECTFEEAVEYTNGRCIFTSTNFFEPVKFDEKYYKPNQASQLYAIPGIALGASLAHATSITDAMLLRAARILATMTSDNDIFENSLLYPDQDHFRAVSHAVAISVLDQALETGIARVPRPDYPLRDYVRNNMYYPQYP